MNLGWYRAGSGGAELCELCYLRHGGLQKIESSAFVWCLYRNNNCIIMTASKILKYFVAIVLGGVLVAQAADSKSDKPAAKAKPYTLKVCPVSDEKLGEMGDPYVFTHEGREIKLCCK